MTTSKLILTGAVSTVIFIVTCENAAAWQLARGQMAHGQMAHGQMGGGLSRWDRPVQLPVRPHPINYVLPWYSPGLYYGTTHTWPRYDRWGRWDESDWDGR